MYSHYIQISPDIYLVKFLGSEFGICSQNSDYVVAAIWEVLDGVGVDGVGVNFLFFCASLSCLHFACVLARSLFMFSLFPFISLFLVLFFVFFWGGGFFLCFFHFFSFSMFFLLLLFSFLVSGEFCVFCIFPSSCCRLSLNLPKKTAKKRVFRSDPVYTNPVRNFPSDALFSRLRPNDPSSGLTNDTREDPITESHRPITKTKSQKIFRCNVAAQNCKLKYFRILFGM